MSEYSRYQQFAPDMGVYEPQRPSQYPAQYPPPQHPSQYPQQYPRQYAPQYGGAPQFNQPPYNEVEQWSGNRPQPAGGYGSYDQQQYDSPPPYQPSDAPPMAMTGNGMGRGAANGVNSGMSNGMGPRISSGAQSPGASLPAGPLPYPVILPQRRPKNRARGFVRAYAPDLMRVGIDQATFMAFLQGFEKSVSSSPLLGVVNLAGGLAGLIPSYIAPPIGMAVQLTAGVAQEVLNRKHQNAYLAKMNEELFQPRGVYCLIMAYAPHSQKTLTQKEVDARLGGAQNGSYRNHDGQMGSIDFPTSAELIYPENEQSSDDDDDDDYQSQSHGQGLAHSQSGEQDGKQQPGMMAGLSKAFEGFKDKRDISAQRKYMRKNPTGALNALLDPKVELTAKDREKQAKRLAKDERKLEKRERKFEKKVLKHPERAERGPKKPKVRENIMYLMIINMPEKGEMEKAMKMIEGREALAVEKGYARQ
ncbi:hypothetical protein F5Y05DRAFT_409976 [Hypoxylon sp. FL0543]|nr:hypothetical protein F5Y05DRAFT_409976 [Hypoxylon sp. FL0543]